MKTPCLKCGLIHNGPTALCDAYAGLDLTDDVAANNRKKAVERIRAVLAAVPVETRSGGRTRAAAAGAGAHASSSSSVSSGSSSSSGPQGLSSSQGSPGPVRPAIVGSVTAEPPAPEVPEWRREVTERLESYRNRRERQRSANQSVLAFRVHSKMETLEDGPEAPAPEMEMAAASAIAELGAPSAEASTQALPQSDVALPPAVQSARVYAPIDDNAAESHSEQAFAAAVETEDPASTGTAETTMIPATEAPALRAALPIPAEPAVVLADSTTLEVHADPPELAEMQSEMRQDLYPGVQPAMHASAATDAAPLATIPAIDADYWRSLPDAGDSEPAPAAVVAESQPGLDAREMECGSLTSGFETSAPRIEEPVMEQEAAPVAALHEDAVLHEDTALQEEAAILAAAPMESEALAAEDETAEAVRGLSFSAAPEAGELTETPEGLETSEEEEPETEVDRRRAALRTAARPPIATPPERVEISVQQPVFDFSPANSDAQQPQDQGPPVADLRERRCAAIFDAAILGVTIAAFFLAFHIAGGEIAFSRAGAAVGIATAFLIYALYILLFTMMGGGTPGMLLRGLHAVCFDGKAPSQIDLTWRAFGYLLSAAAGLFGFVWSAWDEHGLTWHDRISQTYITYAEPAAAPVTASAS